MFVFVVLLFLLAFSVPAFSAGETREEQALTPHYAFSNYFGSGIYASSGQELSVLNLPFNYEPEQDEKFKYRYRLPVSLGFYDYNFGNITDVDFPDEVASITVTAGIEFDHWVSDSVKLVPFLDVGLSDNLQEDERAVIYASGITGFYFFKAWQEDHIWLARWQRAGYRTQDTGISDGFSALETGVDLILPWRFSWLNRPMFMSAYAMQYWYFMDLGFDPDTLDPRQQTNAQELGLTVGFDKALDFGLFDLQRIGIGLRRTNNLYVWRLLMNFPLE